MTLTKIDQTLKTLGGCCAILSGSTFVGFIPPTAALVLGFVAGLFAYLASSPLFDPTLVGKSPWVSRLLLTLAGLSAAAAGSSFFPSVQHLFADDHAKKLAAGLALVAALCTFLSQSPILGGGTKGVGGDVAKLTLLALFGFSLGVSGCAHFDAIVTACKDCVTQDGPSDLRDLEQQAGPLFENVLMCDPTLNAVTLPPCVGMGLAGLVVALGPDGLRFRDCVLSKIETDPAAPAVAKQRARTVRARLARGVPL